MKAKYLALVLGFHLSQIGVTADNKEIQSIIYALQDFKVQNPKLIDSRREPCSLDYTATVAGGMLQLRVSLSGHVPEFQVGFHSDLYQSLSFGKSGKLNPIVENAESDGFGYWSTNRRSLEIWKSSITLVVYDYQSKQSLNQTCYSENYFLP